MKLVKMTALGALVALVAACGGKPQTSSYQGQLPQSGKQIALTRITVPDREGVTTVKAVEVDGKLVDLKTVDESTTTAQDYGQTALAAIGPGVVQWAAAKDLQSSSSCGSGGCGGQPTVVQVVTDVTTTVTGGGCDFCGIE